METAACTLPVTYVKCAFCTAKNHCAACGAELGRAGEGGVALSLLLFAFSSILGWSYYGERCWAYLSNNNKAVVWVFKVVFVLVCIVGATGNGTLMWDISDTLNGMMAIPNLIGLLLLSNVIIRSTNDYFKKH